MVHLDLSTPESVERMRRSLAMLAPKAWALRREEAIEVLTVLCAALGELRQLDATRPAASDGTQSRRGREARPRGASFAEGPEAVP